MLKVTIVYYGFGIPKNKYVKKMLLKPVALASLPPSGLDLENLCDKVHF
jgi:hypothetical protein